MNSEIYMMPPPFWLEFAVSSLSDVKLWIDGFVSEFIRSVG